MKISNVLLETFQGEKILKDPRLVKMIAVHFRNDHTIDPSVRARLAKKARESGQKTIPDEMIAQWFVDALDKMDQNARARKRPFAPQAGQYDQWLGRVYAAGGTSWEDIESRAPQALYDLNLLTRKRKIDSRHADVNRYASVSSLERVVDAHYARVRDELRQDDELEALARDAQAIKLADNEDYLLLAVVNRGAACKYGKGTRWCTSSISSDNYYRRYQEDSPLFILLDKKREGEKYQWHFTSNQFMNPSDVRPDPDTIRQQYPNLLKDLLTGIQANTAEWDSAPWQPPLEKNYGYDTAAGAIEQIKKNVGTQGWRSMRDYFIGPQPQQQANT